ncbi:MAG: ribonuclease E activity regulator RraA [Chloroflexaceae bacterium]|jgi:regulator of ribonuclease activity A|nr:ribonuclease E activity regulator RraA [Chloroflexaceae bacterium]
MLKTTDLCDQYGDEVQVAEPLFRRYGSLRAMSGPMATVQVFEDNVLVRATLEEPGNGRVLVVDGGGSLRCALVGDLIAALAQRNGWAGVVVNGAIRDSHEIGELALGVWALNTSPRRSPKLGQGERHIAVTFAGVTFQPGHYLYADDDGIIVAARSLS